MALETIGEGRERMSYHGSVECSWCNHRGHNRAGCPERKKWIENNPDQAEARHDRERKSRSQNRKCTYCKGLQHNRRTCDMLKSDKINLKDRLQTQRATVSKVLIERGIGIGSLIHINKSYWDKTQICGLIEDMLWVEIDRVDKVKLSVRSVTGETTGYREVDIERLERGSQSIQVLSPISSDLVEASLPEKWEHGSEYREENYIPKGQFRPWSMDG